jgi:hypothetical protein
MMNNLEIIMWFLSLISFPDRRIRGDTNATARPPPVLDVDQAPSLRLFLENKARPVLHDRKGRPFGMRENDSFPLLYAPETK